MNVNFTNQNINANSNIQNKNKVRNNNKQNVSFQKLDNFLPYIQDIHTKKVPPEVQTNVINSLIQAFEQLTKAAKCLDISIYSNGNKGNNELKFLMSPINTVGDKTKINTIETINLKDITPKAIVEAMNNGINKIQEQLKQSCVVCKHEQIPQFESTLPNEKLLTDIFDLKTGKNVLKEKLSDYHQLTKFEQELNSVKRKIQIAKATGASSKKLEKLYQKEDKLIQNEWLRNKLVELNTMKLPKKIFKEAQKNLTSQSKLNISINNLNRMKNKSQTKLNKQEQLKCELLYLKGTESELIKASEKNI
jgi:hypothetical protein